MKSVGTRARSVALRSTLTVGLNRPRVISRDAATAPEALTSV